jgi:hypothetical protein
MRITTPMRVAIVCAFLVAALATMAVSQHGITHAAAPAKKSGKPTARLLVNPSTVMLLTSGGFSTTVYGQGLSPNSYYKLFDNNLLCQDSINTNSPNVLTDLNGRFAYTLNANTLFGPCLTGSFTVSATGGKTKTVTAKVTLAHDQVLPTSANVTPQLVVSLTDGSFATTVNVTGLKPATQYYLVDNTSTCQTNANPDLLFTTDSEGNAELLLHGGPDYFSTGPCNPATSTETIYTTSSVVVTTTAWVLQPAQP